jgi:HEAT repeat protein
MRAIAMIQPPELDDASSIALKDACADIRVVASAGWLIASAIPDDAVPTLVEALRDPENRVRANAASALARLNAIPDEAIPLLIDCVGDASDALRLSAAQALQKAPGDLVAEVMQTLVEDPNPRIRLIAAGSRLTAGSTDPNAGIVLVESLGNPAPRVRDEALCVFESLGQQGAAILDALRNGSPVRAEPEITTGA